MIPSTSACTCCMSGPAAGRRPEPARKPSSLVLPLPSSSADFDGSIAWQLASLFKNQIKILSQRDDATRHTGSDHDRCCGGRAPVCRGSKARPELLPLLAGAAEEMGCQRLGCISCKAATAAVAVFFTVCHIVLHGVLPCSNCCSTLQVVQLFPCVFILGSALQLGQRQLSNVVKIWMRLRAL